MYKDEEGIANDKTNFIASTELSGYTENDLIRALSKKQCVVCLPCCYDLRKHNNKEFQKLLENYDFRCECEFYYNEIKYLNVVIINRNHLLSAIDNYRESNELDNSVLPELRSIKIAICQNNFEYFII